MAVSPTSLPAAVRAASGLIAERLRLYHSGKWSAIVGQAAIGLLLLWVVRPEVSAGAAWAWSGVAGATLVLRALCDVRFREPRGAGNDLEAAADLPRQPGSAEVAELRRTRATVVAMGAAFGAASVLVFPTGNWASYPGGTTPSPIHTAGGTASGDVRHYQCWYRDANPVCTSATYNLTQGVTLTWGP